MYSKRREPELESWAGYHPKFFQALEVAHVFPATCDGCPSVPYTVRLDGAIESLAHLPRVPLTANESASSARYCFTPSPSSSSLVGSKLGYTYFAPASLS